MTFDEAYEKCERNYFGMMMVEVGDADALITGVYKILTHSGRQRSNWHSGWFETHWRYAHYEHKERNLLPSRYTFQPPSNFGNAYRCS